ncbi:MAG TPA: Fe-S protein assembly co-chaperone HscB [Burkholderiales bacterium]|jgi:molecular chaperone HscB|nr:Fe-S protein assembly co-chaperone HscB [Burkholderiales bacterium]
MSAAAARASTSSSYFELFGLPRVFALDLPALERTYREVQARVHPDRFAHAGDAERRASLQWTTRINEAFRALRNPVSRAAHLLALHGVDVAFETNTAMPQQFLMQQMELREALETAVRGKDPKALAKLQNDLQADKEGLEKLLAERIDRDQDYPAAAGLVRELQFLEKLEAEIDGAYEMIQ